MKKHELLKHAYDNYPKGTKFKNLTTGKENTSVGSFEAGTFGITTSEEIDGGKTLLCRYKDLEWAEIVNPKIAVKVENEKEFHALMKYYDSLGYKHWNDNAKFVMGEYVEFQNDFAFLLEGQQKDFEVFSFSDFAKEHNIKLPLLKSEDCVWLYEGDRFYRTYFSNGKWEFNSDWSLVNDSYVITHPDEFKAFSTKQSALEWIEAQKPKDIEVSLFDFSTVKCFVTKDMVRFSKNNTPYGIVNLRPSDIDKIQNALKELS